MVRLCGCFPGVDGAGAAVTVQISNAAKRENMCKQNILLNNLIVTAGAHYLDIDAYACMVTMAELLRLQGYQAIAYSHGTNNYSVCPSLVVDGQIAKELPSPQWEKNGRTGTRVRPRISPGYLGVGSIE